MMYYSLFLSLASISSRGFVELFFSKSFSYFVAFLGFFIFLMIFFYNTKARVVLRGTTLLLSLSFIASSFVSLMISLFYGLKIIYTVYLVYPLAIALFFLLFYSIDTSKINVVKLRNTIATVIVLLFSIALLEQLHVLHLPGETFTFGVFIRPASLTGSYLHYPLIMILFASIVHTIDNKLTKISFLGYLSVFVAFSRSGMMLVSVIICMTILFKLHTFKIKLTISMIVYFVLTVFVVILFLTYSDVLNLIWDRLISSVNINSAGNPGRIEAWSHGLKIIANSNFLFGNNFGTITNLTVNLTGAKSSVVESGFLQMLVNFGIIGTTLFYAIFAYMYRYSYHRIQKGFLIAFVLQSFVYQSIEVLPFIMGSYLLFSLTKKQAIKCK